MSKTPDAERDALPQFTTRTPDGEWEPVLASAWVRLERPRGLPPRPPGNDIGEDWCEITSRPFGPRRLGRRLVTYEVEAGPSETDQFWPIGDPLPDREPYQLAIVDPPIWRARQFRQAHRAALRILIEIGLRPGHLSDGRCAYWVHQAADGRWWALFDDGDSVPAPGEARGGVDRLALDDLAGIEDAPLSLLDYLGGPDGPFEWALLIVGQARRLARLRGDSARGLSALMDLPEWTRLRAAAGIAGGDSLIALHQLESVGRGVPADTLAGDLFDEAFDLGLVMGLLEASRALQESEAARSPGKVALRAELRSIAVEQAKKGALQPYALAKQLVSERTTTDRGKRLAKLGLADDPNRVGMMLSEEAKAAGLR